MATIIAAAGGGNFTAGGTWVGGVAPTAADDTQLTASSGNVTINSGSVCRSFAVLTGYIGTVTHTAGVTFTIGDGTAGAGSVAWSWGSTGTYTLGSTTTSAVSFISTSATVQTITTATKPFGNVTFNGVAGSWQFADGYTATATTVTLTNGTLDLNGKTFSWSTFNANNSNTRTLTLGAASITCALAGTAWNIASSAGLTFTTNTATVTLTGAGSQFNGFGGNHNGLSIVLSGSGTQTCNASGATVANLTRTGTASKTDALSMANITVTGVLTLTGNTAVNRLYVFSSTEGTARTIAMGATGTASFTNVDFRDITMTGINAPFGGTSIGDALHNSGITFDAPTTQNHDGTTSNASTAARWTSRVPLPQDTVTCTSGSGTITFDMPRIGADVDFTGFTGTASFASIATTLYGSLKFATGMTVSGTQGLTFAARSTKTITSNGKAFTMVLSFGTTAGTIQLGDAFSGTSVTVSFGTFDANGQNFTYSGNYIHNNGTTTNMGTGTWTATGTGTIWQRGSTATVNAQSSTLAITDTSSSNKTFNNSNPVTFNIVTITPGGTGIIIFGTSAAALTFATLNCTGGAKNLRFFAGQTINIGSAAGWNVSGTSGNLVTIDTTTAGTAATLTKTEGVVSSDYLSLKDSTATGGAAWFAGANSTNVSGNTGWVFTAVPVAKGGTLAMMGV